MLTTPPESVRTSIDAAGVALSEMSTHTTGPSVARRPVHEADDAPLRVAIIGAGFIADYHMEILRETPRVEVVVACDPSAGRLKAFAARWGIPRLASSVDDLLTGARPDVAHVLVPPAHHYRVAKQLLEAGVHVLLEKPMALCSRESNELANIALDHQVCLGINHNWLHHPLFQRALCDIAQRKIGPVRHVISMNSLPLYQLSSGQHDHWMFDEPTNILFEQGVHPLSQVCRLIGDVLDVTAKRLEPRTLRGGKEFFTNWQLAIEGARASAQMSLAFGSIFPDVQLRIIGQDGAIHIDQLNDLYIIDRRSRLIDAGDRFVRGLRQARGFAVGACRGLLGYGLSLLRVVGRRDSYYLGMKGSIGDFYRCVRLGEATGAGSENGQQTIAAIEKIVDRFGDLTVVARQTRNEQTAPRHTPSTMGRVIVFGASGFVGRKVVSRLFDSGVAQRLFVRSKKRVADLPVGPQLDVFEGDVNSAEQVHEAVAGCESIVHLVAGAPKTWIEFERLFVGGLKNVANAALDHGVKRLLFASSITSLYLGNRDELITEQTPVDKSWNKRCDYARAKVMCEQLLLDMHARFGLPAVILRPGIVLGEGAPAQHLGVGEWPSETLCVRWGRDVDGSLPFVLVDDVAEAFYRALHVDPNLVAGKAFNLVGDVRMSAKDYIEILRNESERDFRLHRQSVAFWTGLELIKWAIKAAAFKPENSRLTWRELSYRTGAARFDCSQAKSALNWTPESDRYAFVDRGIRAALRGWA
jgi:predicted dehydrogenase/nucleoside-diphosphate-sugar epimerase